MRALLTLSLSIAGLALAADLPAADERGTTFEFPSGLVEPEGLPVRVHVVEDFETDIERKWWLRGTVETENLPPTTSRSLPNARACRAAETKDFGDLQGDPTQTYKAVVFNPVPGPPMGDRTRLSFRYFLEGASDLRIQIYSLSNGYHRRLTLRGLPRRRWQSATVDLTLARRPDGNGGPLSADERIDDIQFYVDREAELLIDDILLYQAPAGREDRPPPRKTVFTGWFDTGEQGQEWPGQFEIVPHEAPLTWKTARSTPDVDGSQSIQIGLRGERPLPRDTRVRFRYRLSEPGPLSVSLVGKKEIDTLTSILLEPQVDQWCEAEIDFQCPAAETGEPASIAEVRFSAPSGEILLDDLLLYEPGGPIGLANDHDWIERMQKVHARFAGRKGTIAQFGDSITISMAYWAPLAGGTAGATPNTIVAGDRVRDYMLPECWRDWKGPEFGNNGSMTIRWADENVEAWLKDLNPEVALIMFGTNDLDQFSAEEYEQLTRRVVGRLLENGTVPILSTIPPRSGRFEQSAQFAEIVRRIARDEQVPLVDYFAQIVDRRPDDWDGALPAFADSEGDEYQVPTLISRDGVHPSFPATWARDYSAEGLNRSGYTLRSYLSLMAYSEVIEQVLRPHAVPARFPHRIWAACDFEGQTPDYGWFGPAQTGDIPAYPGNRTALGVGERPFGDFAAIMTGINPVPGTRMGVHNGLYLRYRLSGASEATFQHFSLTSEDNQHVRAASLPNGEWSELTLDFSRDSARNDGSPRRFGEGERMDDFKVFAGRPGDEGCDLAIDDVIFFSNDPRRDPEPEAFPNRVIFLAAFDTGEQERYWPGDLDIVDRDLPPDSFWRAARAVPRENGEAGQWIRLAIQPPRPVGEQTRLRFRYYASATAKLTVQLFDTTVQDNRHVRIGPLAPDRWVTQYVDFTRDSVRNDGSEGPFAAGNLVDDLFFFVEPPEEGPFTFLVDEVVLYDARVER